MPTDLESEFDAAFETTPELPEGVLDEIETPGNVFMGDDPETEFGGKLSDSLDGDEDDGSGVETDEDPTEDNPEEGDDDESLTDQVFDWTTEKDKLVTVKIGGVETKVKLGDALNGYMRQEDYTRKTQELAKVRQAAEWAHEMQQALRTDPAGTLRSLQQALGVADVSEDDPLADLDPELRPLHERQMELDRRLAEQEQARQQEQILREVKAEIASVQDEFPDFVAETVLPEAMKRGVSIRDAYLLVKADEMLANQKAEAAAKAKAAERAKIEAKKRTANGQIASGGTGSRGVPSGKPPVELNSFDEMLTYEFDKAGT